MRKKRKHYSAEEKVAIVRRHLIDQVPVAQLCDELGLQPSLSTWGRRKDCHARIGELTRVRTFHVPREEAFFEPRQDFASDTLAPLSWVRSPSRHTGT